MLVMTEYTGLLMGGPDEGNPVTSSVATIPVTNTIELWLDGKKDDTDVTIIVVKGIYTWEHDYNHFVWQPFVTSYFTKKAEKV